MLLYKKLAYYTVLTTADRYWYRVSENRPKLVRRGRVFVSFRDFGANNMAHESGHESDENFEQSLENEVARASNDEPNSKAVATELGNVFADQFTALAEHLQQGISSLERTMTQAMRTKRKSSSGSGSSNHSEQEATSIKEPKRAKKSTTDDLTEQVEDLLNTQKEIS